MVKIEKWSSLPLVRAVDMPRRRRRSPVSATGCLPVMRPRQCLPVMEAVSSEWNDKYPDGIDGQICIFNVIGGALVYIMKDKMKQKESVKKIFDPDRGDDVFSRPSAGHTSDLAAVSVGIDQLDDTLAIIGQSLQDALTERAGNEEQQSAAPRRTAGPSFTEKLRGTG
jgi:hypothetical protein